MRIKVTVIFLFLCELLFSQNYSGQVLDAFTKQPIESVSVYFDGTTIGTTTNSNGFFTINLKDNKSTNSLLVISFIGYESIIINTDAFKDNTIYNLVEKQTALGEVVLFDNWSRKKKLRVFKDQFLGFNKATLQCKIENEKAIKLVYNKHQKQLYATATEPIIVVNKALGYKIYYDLIDFEVTFSNCINCLKKVESVFYSGTTRFEELNLKRTKSKYIKARQKSYFGSLLHFMRVLAKNKTKEAHFKFFIKSTSNTSKLFYNTDVKNLVKVSKKESVIKVNLLYKSKIIVRFKDFEQSFLLIQDDDKTFTIDDYGIHSPVDKIIFGGRFGNSRLSTMLPNNYYPN